MGPTVSDSDRDPTVDPLGFCSIHWPFPLLRGSLGALQTYLYYKIPAMVTGPGVNILLKICHSDVFPENLELRFQNGQEISSWD